MNGTEKQITYANALLKKAVAGRADAESILSFADTCHAGNVIEWIKDGTFLSFAAEAVSMEKMKKETMEAAAPLPQKGIIARFRTFKPKTLSIHFRYSRKEREAMREEIEHTLTFGEDNYGFFLNPSNGYKSNLSHIPSESLGGYLAAVCAHFEKTGETLLPYEEFLGMPQYQGRAIAPKKPEPYDGKADLEEFYSKMEVAKMIRRGETWDSF